MIDQSPVNDPVAVPVAILVVRAPEPGTGTAGRWVSGAQVLERLT